MSLKKVVVKFGTEHLFGGNAHLDQGVFDVYAAQIATLLAEGVQVVVVSSGAIAAGKERLVWLGKDPGLFTKKELASIGTRHIFNRWGVAFERYSIDVAPVLVTYANWETPAERQSVKNSILGCAQKGMVPVINENDVVSDEEIKLMEKGISENDRLARMIATLIECDGVLFLTNVAGVYERNPAKDPTARRFLEVDHATIHTHDVCLSDDTSTHGRGGIASKIKEAACCVAEIPGVSVAIAGGEENVILRFARGEHVGTRFGHVSSFVE
jgi:glutamate 5-kinase